MEKPCRPCHTGLSWESEDDILDWIRNVFYYGIQYSTTGFAY